MYLFLEGYFEFKWFSTFESALLSKKDLKNASKFWVWFCDRWVISKDRELGRGQLGMVIALKGTLNMKSFFKKIIKVNEHVHFRILRKFTKKKKKPPSKYNHVTYWFIRSQYFSIYIF